MPQKLGPPLREVRKSKVFPTSRGYLGKVEANLRDIEDPLGEGQPTLGREPLEKPETPQKIVASID